MNTLGKIQTKMTKLAYWGGAPPNKHRFSNFCLTFFSTFSQQQNLEILQLFFNSLPFNIIREMADTPPHMIENLANAMEPAYGARGGQVRVIFSHFGVARTSG